MGMDSLASIFDGLLDLDWGLCPEFSPLLTISEDQIHGDGAAQAVSASSYSHALAPPPPPPPPPAQQSQWAPPLLPVPLRPPPPREATRQTPPLHPLVRQPSPALPLAPLTVTFCRTRVSFSSSHFVPAADCSDGSVNQLDSSRAATTGCCIVWHQLQTVLAQATDGRAVHLAWSDARAAGDLHLPLGARRLPTSCG